MCKHNEFDFQQVVLQNVPRERIRFEFQKSLNYLYLDPLMNDFLF